MKLRHAEKGSLHLLRSSVMIALAAANVTK